ncbi:gamma-secretase subunit pen-2 [Nilaparvata lugens]|uniref:Gamma-secretase subunit PEN-2 n=1 Tax=Laodelphax striatellus TaxID=195883 RepID=A0A482XMI3_LAOST|nr:gamma-secretase subunit pen-2 [Nilaparvata lugens]RZF46927.1 hypothetical protein LSTR_LSTR013239 [Laodelphax striatellus]
MDISRMNNGSKLYLCKWYFRAGFACLPIVWLINSVWFFEEAFKKPPYEEQAQIKRYVTFSGIGAAIWIVGMAIWVYIFQTHRAEWGEFGDDLTFTIPTGIK